MQLARQSSTTCGNSDTAENISSSKTNETIRNVEKEHSVHILNIIGDKGRYQLLVAGLCLMSNIVASWNVLGYTFFVYPVDYWCARPNNEDFKNMTTEEWKNLSTISNTINGSSKCLIHEVIYDGDTFRCTGETVKCQAWEYHHLVFRETIVSKWNLVCDGASRASTCQTVYMVGFLLSVLIFGQLGDSLGRRPVLLFGIVLYLVAGLITSLVNSFFFFVFCRFFVALGIHGTSMTAFVVLMECVGRQYRPLHYLSLSVGWAIGYTTIPGLAFVTRTWTYLQLSFVAFGLTLLPLWWYCLESPRWLLLQGKYETAESVMITVAQRNGIWNETIHMKIQEIILNSDKKPRERRKSTLIDLFRTSTIRRNTLILLYIWFATGFVYYGITLNLADFVGDLFANTAIFGALEFVSAIIGLFWFTFATRRNTFMALFFVVSVLCFCTAGIPGDLRCLRSTLAATGKVVVEIAFDLAYLYSAEVFPTGVRNAGVGICSAVARIGSTVAPLMKNMISTTGKAVPFAVFGAVTIVAGLLVLLIPETKNQELQDTLDEGQCHKEIKVNTVIGDSKRTEVTSSEKASNPPPPPPFSPQ